MTPTSRRSPSFKTLPNYVLAGLLIGFPMASVNAVNITGDTVTTNLTVQGNALLTGNLEVQGVQLELGQSGTEPGITINYIPPTTTDPGEVQFLQADHTNKGEWVWALKPTSGSEIIQMTLSKDNALKLLNPTNATQFIEIKPASGQITINNKKVLLEGDVNVPVLGIASGVGSTSLGSVVLDGSTYTTTASGQGSVALAGGTASGENSFAFGGNTEYWDNNLWTNLSNAQGSYSVAFSGGYAAGERSFAFGGNTYGDNSVAMVGGQAWGPGSIAIAGGKTYGSGSFALGFNATVANPNQSSVWTPYASPMGSFAMGSNAYTDASFSFVFGSTVKARKQHTFAFGRNSEAEGDYSFAIGNNSDAGKNFSGTFYRPVHALAFGDNTNANGDYSLAFGHKARTGGRIGSVDYASTNALAFGYESKAMNTNAIAIGDRAEAFGTSSITLGSLSKTYSHGAIVVGEANVDFYSNDGNSANDARLIVGNGGYNDGWYHQNSMVQLKSGDLRVSGKIEAKEGLRTKPMGDLSMGDFTSGTNPATLDPEAGLKYSGE